MCFFFCSIVYLFIYCLIVCLVFCVFFVHIPCPSYWQQQQDLQCRESERGERAHASALLGQSPSQTRRVWSWQQEWLHRPVGVCGYVYVCCVGVSCVCVCVCCVIKRNQLLTFLLSFLFSFSSFFCRYLAQSYHRGTGNHVWNKVLVTWRVQQHHTFVFCFEYALCNVDGHASGGF